MKKGFILASCVLFGFNVLLSAELTLDDVKKSLTQDIVKLPADDPVRKKSLLLFGVLKKIDGGGDANLVGANEITPLSLAMEVGNQTAVEYLVKKGANLLWVNSAGISPYNLCTNPDLKKWFISNLSIKTMDEATLVLDMIIKDLETQLAEKTDEEKKSPDGALPLVQQHLRSVELKKALAEVVANPVTINKVTIINIPTAKSVFPETNTPLTLAIRLGLPDLAALCINNKANLNGTSSNIVPLAIAAAMGDIQTLELLLKKEADFKKRGIAIINPTETSSKSPMALMDIAVHSPNALEVIKCIFNNTKGAILKDNYASFFTSVAGLGNKELLDYALSLDVPGGAWFALYGALNNNDEETAQYIIQKGTDINKLRSDSSTVLIELIKQANPKVDAIKLALKLGADRNLKDKKGKTALDYAKTDEVKALLTPQ